MRPEQHIARLLVAGRLTLSLAESCTGGLISHRLTQIPGSSAFLKLTVVAYANEAKSRILGVSPAVIRHHGAVSAQTAQGMARGVKKILKTDFGLSVTGIAGPGGGTKRKPVGLTYIALCTKNSICCQEHHFQGSRTQIKNQAATAALQLLLQALRS